MNQIDKRSFILGGVFTFLWLSLFFYIFGTLLNGPNVVHFLQLFAIQVKLCMLHLPEGVCGADRLRESLLADIAFFENHLFEEMNSWFFRFK